ncbi:hypothetical protein U1Q18_046321 [Sarracenia purpurea var. burkii]
MGATAKLAGLTAAAGEAQITGGERRAWRDQHRRRRRNRKQALGAAAPQPRQRTGARRTPGAATASLCAARGGQVRRQGWGQLRQLLFFARVSVNIELRLLWVSNREGDEELGFAP